MFSIFVMSFIIRGGSIRHKNRHNYALTISGSIPPYGALMRPLPLRWKTTGKVEPSFIFSHKTIFLEMSSKKNCLNGKYSTEQTTPTSGETLVQEIKQLHAANTEQSSIERLMALPIKQLFSEFLVEQDAKNEAYYFILQKGLYDSFVTYCKTGKHKK